MFFDFNKTPSLYMYILFPFIEFIDAIATVQSVKFNLPGGCKLQFHSMTFGLTATFKNFQI